MQTAADDVMKSFLDFAVAAIDLVGTPVILRLDTAEKLHDDDFAQLLDLTDGCPEGLAVWIGHANADHASANRVHELEIAGAAVIPIGGLEYPALMEWLKDESVPPSQANQIAITTLGYPLFVLAAIEHLQRGRVLSELRGEAAFVAQTRQNFQGLPIDLQRTCLSLAAHAVPLDHAQAPRAIDVDPETWSLHESHLIERRLLSAVVDDQAWFHELARRALWNEAFTDVQRAISADKAISFLLGEVRKSRTYSLEHARGLVDLFEASETQAVAYPEVQVCLELSREPLGLLAALLELQEPPDNAVDADMLFEHARCAFGLEGDLTASLRQLESMELVVLAENDWASVVIGHWKSTALRLVLLGRAMIEFDRTLLPATASTIFELLFRPSLDTFLGAHHGVGRPTLTALAENAQKFDASEVDGVISIHGRFGVLVRSRWGHVPLYATIGFERPSERDEAIESLANLDSQEIFGERLTIETLTAWPHPEPLPQGLLETAAATISLVSGRASDRAGRSSPEVATNLEQRLQIMMGIRSALTPFEREVLELNPVPGFVWASGERGVVIAHVSGLGEVREVPALLERDLTKFWKSIVAQVCDLTPEQRATRLVLHPRAPSASEALHDIVKDLSKTLQSFNKANRWPTMALGSAAEDFETAIVAALERRRAMIGAMGAAVGRPPELDQPTGSHEFVIYLEPEAPAFFRGANGLMLSKVDETETFAVSVRVVDDPAEATETLRRWRTRESASSGLEFSQSDLLYGLDELLGFGGGGRFVEIRRGSR